MIFIDFSLILIDFGAETDPRVSQLPPNRPEMIYFTLKNDLGSIPYEKRVIPGRNHEIRDFRHSDPEALPTNSEHYCRGGILQLYLI